MKAWLIAGTLDITAASVYYPIAYKFRLIPLYQNIASGVFGVKAFAGGAGMAALGLLFHYFIALSWTVFFFVIFPKLTILSRNRFVTGMGYGIFVWLVMNLVVVPLSRVDRQPFVTGQVITSVAFLMFCVGLPLSIIIGGHFMARSTPARQRTE